VNTTRNWCEEERGDNIVVVLDSTGMKVSSRGEGNSSEGEGKEIYPIPTEKRRWKSEKHLQKRR